MVAYTAVARLPSPPPTVAEAAVAWLLVPPPTVALSPLARLPTPPPTVASSFVALLATPPLTVAHETSGGALLFNPVSTTLGQLVEAARKPGRLPAASSRTATSP